MADFEAARGLTENGGKTLLNPQEANAGQPLGFHATLEKNAEKCVELPQGAAAVQGLSVKLGSYEDPAVTRRVVLKMEFHGSETVWCPVGDFFGSGRRRNASRWTPP